MPHFSKSGHDMVLCQVCGRDIDTGKDQPEWRVDITGNKSAGNVCPSCVAMHDDKPVSLYEHCKQESGLIDHSQIMAYLNRHYGHG